MPASFHAYLISSISIYTVEKCCSDSIHQIYRGTVCVASLSRQILPLNPGAHTFPLKFHLNLSAAEKKNKPQLGSIYQIAKTAMKRNRHCSYYTHEIQNINITL